MKKILCLTYLILFLIIQTGAQNNTIPGTINTLYPTLINLAVEWNIEGDDNLNGIVNIQYREKFHQQWKEGMPLFRVPAGENIGFSWANKHSGSIFDLKPGTSYEIKLTLNDPDGGSVTQTVEATTRTIPGPGKNAEYVAIKPGNYDTLHTKSGTAEKNVVYHCPDGIATFRYINLKNRKFTVINGLNVENLSPEGIGIQLNGAENCVVTRCNINAVFGIVAYKPGAKCCYISDNIITGTCEWTNSAMGAHGENIGEGIEMTGPGNIICYNKITGFRDCISTMEDQHVVDQTCIDIYNNDIYSGVDDAIEADFCFSNCRIFRNRITNSFVGLSSQPGLGGPNYFYRNVMYNLTHGAFKLKRFSQGDIVMHNTVVKVGAGLGGNSKMDFAWFRNNLAIGGPDGGVNWGDYGAGKPSAAEIIEPGTHSSFDYDAVGVYQIPYTAEIGEKPFSEIEKHGIENIDLSKTFNKVEFPLPPVPARNVPDLRLKPGSAAIDAGMPIPNVNNDYTGKAPDCGALEYGQEAPHYGPR